MHVSSSVSSLCDIRMRKQNTTLDEMRTGNQLLGLRANREQTPEMGEQIHPFRGFATRRGKDWSCALNYGGPESVIAHSETRPLITYQGGKDEI